MGCLNFFKKDKSGAPFRYIIEDVFTIKGRGIVVVGTILTGTLHKGDKLTLGRADGSATTVTVGGIEKYRQGMVSSAAQGENVGILLEEIGTEDVSRGDCLMA